MFKFIGLISCWGYVLRLNGYKTPLWRLYKFASGTKLLPFLEWQLLDWVHMVLMFSSPKTPLIKMFGTLHLFIIWSEIMSRIPELVILCRESTFFMVVEHFGGDHNRALCLAAIMSIRNRFNATASSMKSFNTVLQKKEVNDILDIVHTCIGLCQRNSPRMDFDESESLWFRLLDSFCEPLIDSYSTRINSEGKFNTENNSVHRIRWKLSRFQKGAHILRKLFSLFIKAIVEGMIGYVRLPTIMMKLLSDNGSQEFGDFKLTIL
ncbi:hypothetical protein POM88_007261 [Heracleum sosnowskyi]|uniref:Uncharacterized protein n=1 Tax=Heracleum sosnowskyi TaxID=360622 RepID=A0AAD8N7D8_9APIA|nr:hypothetical protein POM88_007261 [Heracleum sosnowskyi]